MKKPGGVLWWLLGIVGGVLLVAALTLLWHVNHARKQLETYRAELIARGEKLSEAELLPASSPSSKNQTRELVEAAQEVRQRANGKTISPVSSVFQQTRPGYAIVRHRAALAQAAPKQVPWEKVTQEMADLTESLQRLKQAIQALPPEDLFPAGGPVSTEIDSLFRGGQYLNQQTFLRLHEGDWAGAIDNTILLLRFARLCQSQPSLRAQFLGNSFARWAAPATWEILQESDVSAADLLRLQEAWTQLHPTQLLTQGLRLERARGLVQFNDPAEAFYLPSPGAPSAFNDFLKSIGVSLWVTTCRDNDEKGFLADFQSLIDHVPEEGKPWMPFQETTDKILQEQSKQGLRRLLSHLITAYTGTSFWRFPATEAAQNLTITALAICRYQLDHQGHPPPTLAALIPAYLSRLPLDPMDGAPLRYKIRSDSDYLLYAIGQDGKDDGGDPSETIHRNYFDFTERRDIVWPMPEMP